MDEPVVDKSFRRLRFVRRMRIAAITATIRSKPAMAIPIAKSRCGMQIVLGSYALEDCKLKKQKALTVLLLNFIITRKNLKYT